MPAIHSVLETVDGLFAFSSLTQVNGSTNPLEDLSQTDLSSVSESSLRSYAFIMDRKLAHVLEPLDFAYYNFYTFHELLFYPAMAVTQGSSLLSSIKTTFHVCPKQSTLLTPTEFELASQPSKEKAHVCFITYPANSTANDVGLSLQYLKSFDSINIQSYSIFLTALYVDGKDDLSPLIN